MIFLITIDGHDGTSVVTRYFSDIGITIIDDPPIWYEPRVIDAGNLEEHLFSQGHTRGKSEVGSGDVILASAFDKRNGSTLDDFLNWSTSGRRILIQSLASKTLSIVEATTLFIGTMDELGTDNAYNQINLRVHNKLSDVDLPLLTDTWLGTTVSGGDFTAEGDVNLTGAKKQRCYGSVFNVTPQTINPFDLVYAFSDNAVVAIDVLDRGAPLLNSGDMGDPISLFSWVQVAGHYVTLLSRGWVRLGSSPTLITGNVVEGSTLADRSPGQIVTRMLNDFYGITSGNLVGTQFPSDATLTTNIDPDSLSPFAAGAATRLHETATDAAHFTIMSVTKAESRITYQFQGNFRGYAGRRLVLGLLSADFNSLAGICVDLSTGVVDTTIFGRGSDVTLQTYEVSQAVGNYKFVSIVVVSDSGAVARPYIGLNAGGIFLNDHYVGDTNEVGVFYDPATLRFQEVSAIDDLSVARLDAQIAPSSGILVQSDTTCLDAIQTVLDSIGGYFIPNTTGHFQVGRLVEPPGVFSSGFDTGFFHGGEIFVDDASILKDSLHRYQVGWDGKMTPVYRVTAKYKKNETVTQGNQIVGAVGAEDRTFLENEWRSAVAEDLTVLNTEIVAREMVIETCLVSEDDALAEANRLLSIYKRKRAGYRLKLPLSIGDGAKVGTNILLTSDRLNLTTGQTFTVLGRINDFQAEEIELEIWGVQQ